MKVIAQPAELSAGSHKVSLAIGVFDGVHLGHQQVIRQTITDARQHNGLAVAVTFDRHPSTVVAPHRTPPLLYSLSQKLRVIAGLGVDAILLLHFDKALSQVRAEQFIHDLARGFGQVHSICVGSNFSFGHQKKGNVALLKTLGQELSFAVHGLAAVSLDGNVISSTRIRECIRQGNLDAASQMLGRAYSVSGKVLPGDQLGRKLGAPTANLDVTGLLLPPAGVYAGLCQIVGEDPGLHPSALNIGYRPTLNRPQPELRLEVHLLDWSGDLYGKELEVILVEKLRDEQKFASVEALQRQIQADIESSRRVLMG